MSSEVATKKKRKAFGPGALVAAAFIGPGTVTTCTLTGANYGFTLIWAMVLSILCTIIVQEMSLRIGLVTKKGVGENLRERFHGGFYIFIAILVIAAMFIGNCAYETGNLTGSTLGLTALFEGDIAMWPFILIIAAVAFVLLFFGNFGKIQLVMTILVIAMSALFIITAIIVQAPVFEVVKGMFVPSVPGAELTGQDPWLYIVSLVGTTVVPYNIFLHASASAEAWDGPEDIKRARWDSVISIVLGGVISICIIITAAACFNTGMGQSTVTIANGKDMAIQLEPLLGSAARYMFGIGLFAAGFTSAIAAPLAAACASSGILGWGSTGDAMKKWKFRMFWLIVLAVGIILGISLGSSPTQIIIFAQAANAIVLPVVAILIAIVCNSKDIMGNYKNGVFGNIVAIIIIVVAVFMAIRSFTAVSASITALMAA